VSVVAELNPEHGAEVAEEIRAAGGNRHTGDGRRLACGRRHAVCSVRRSRLSARSTSWSTTRALRWRGRFSTTPRRTGIARMGVNVKGVFLLFPSCRQADDSPPPRQDRQLRINLSFCRFVSSRDRLRHEQGRGAADDDRDGGRAGAPWDQRPTRSHPEPPRPR